MKLKKSLLLAFVLVILSLNSFFSVSAHPGRTDANGGHWDRSNGTYHFHTGEYAGKSSSASPSNSVYVPFTPPYDPPTENPYKQKGSDNTASKDSRAFGDIVLSALGIAVCFCFAVATISSIGELLYDNFFEKHLPKYKINTLINKLNEYQCCQNNIAEINMKIFDLELELQVPNLYEIGDDALPRDKESLSNWGKTFTLYRAGKGTKLHTKYNCCCAAKPVHIYWYRGYRNFTDLLCKKCARNYKMPDLSWYACYVECKEAKIKRDNIEYRYKLLEENIDTLHKKCNSIKTKILVVFSKKNKKALQEANEKYINIRLRTKQT